MLGDYEGLVIAVYEQAVNDYFNAIEELPKLKKAAEELYKQNPKILSMSQVEYNNYRSLKQKRNKAKSSNEENKLRTKYRRYNRWIKEDENTIRECEVLFDGNWLLRYMDIDVDSANISGRIKEIICNKQRRKQTNGSKTYHG